MSHGQPLVEETIRCFGYLKVTTLQYKHTLLQVHNNLTDLDFYT